MLSISTVQPLQILAELQSACHQRDISSTATPLDNSIWSGLGFRVQDYMLCINSKDISEILDAKFQNNLSYVPGAKDWLIGLVSLRGQALPVVDLNLYLFNKKTQLTDNSRLLIIKFSDRKIGLITDETFGLKKFSPKQQDSIALNKLASEIKQFALQVYQANDQMWIEFSIHNLENDPSFLNAARF